MKYLSLFLSLYIPFLCVSQINNTVWTHYKVGYETHYSLSKTNLPLTKNDFVATDNATGALSGNLVAYVEFEGRSYYSTPEGVTAWDDKGEEHYVSPTYHDLGIAKQFHKKDDSPLKTITHFEIHKGQLWAGGEHLFCISDNKWERVELPFDKRSFSIPKITSMKSMKDGTLWVGTHDCYFIFKNNSWTAYYGKQYGTYFVDIAAIEETPDGKKYIGFYGGLLELNKGSYTLYTKRNSGIASNRISALKCLSDGMLLIGSSEGHLMSLHKGVWKKDYWKYRVREVTNIHVDSQNKWWVSTDDKTYFQENGNWMEKKGQAWIDAKGNMLEIDLEFGEHSLTSLDIRYVAVDDSNKVWCNSKKGITSIYNGTFENHHPYPKSIGNYVTSFFQDGKGQKYFNHNRGLTIQKTDGTYDFITFYKDGVWQSAVIENSKGQIMLGTLSGEIVVIENNKYVKTYNVNTRENINCIAEDDKGHIWFSTRNTFGYIKDGEKVLVDFDEQRMECFNVKCMVALNNGAIAMGTDAGIYIYKDGAMEHLLPERYYWGENITHIFQGKNDVLWIAAEKTGIHRFDGQKWMNFNYKNSPLPKNQVNSIVEDNNGDVWIGMYKGLFHFNFNKYLSLIK